MHTFFQTLKKAGAVLTFSVLTLGCLYSPVSPLFISKQAEATGLPVIDAAGLTQTTVSAVATVGIQGSSWSLMWKELVGDGIAWALIDRMIEQMIRETTAWVNSGFQGKPAFVQNFGKFMGNIADQVAGDYIWKTDALKFLCSPFKLNVKLALDIQYNGGIGGTGGATSGGMRDYHRSMCTLSGSIANVQGALGNFMNQDWQNWFEVTQRPENNQYGAFFEAQSGLLASIETAQGNASTELHFGSGFLSFKDSNGNITTPGAIIENQLNDKLSSPTHRLEAADEINELIGALLNQLVQGVLSNVGGGLAGMGGGESGSDGVFNDPRYGTSTGGSALTPQFDADKATETQYISLATQGKTQLDGVPAGGSCDASVRQQITSKSAELGAGIAKAQTNLTTIQSFATQSANASATDAAALLNQYMSTVFPTLHTSLDVDMLKESLKTPATTDTEELKAIAATGNIPALVKLCSL